MSVPYPLDPSLLRVILDLSLAKKQRLYTLKNPDRFTTQYFCTYLRGFIFVYFIWDYRVCHFLTASFPVSTFSPFYYLVYRYDVFLGNEESKNSIEDWLNLTCFRTFIAVHWKRDVSKEPFKTTKNNTQKKQCEI